MNLEERKNLKMGTTATVIVDNIACGELGGEWGLSILVEHNDEKIIADVGSSELFAENLKKLKIDIADIDYATLSHAHFDHSNGMPRFFKDNTKAKFYVRETTGENCYFKKYFFHKYIGIPKHIMTDYKDRIEVVSGDYELTKGVYLIPHKTPGLEAIGKQEMMYQKVGRKWMPDNFYHEQSLVIDTDKGLVIINCCSHGGAANIINEVAKTFPDKHVYALIGGFHLFRRSEEEIREVSKKILDTGIDCIVTGHCTKQRAYGIMKEELGDRLSQLQSGLVLEF